MTTSEIRRNVRSWFLPALVGLLTVALAVEFMLLIPLLHDNARQAEQGRAARARQCETKPIARRVYSWLETQGVISSDELRLFLDGAPSDAVCRAVKQS